MIGVKMRRKVKASFARHPDRFSVIFLALLEIAIVLLTIIIMGKDMVWGADTDWKSQHFAIPEYFRTRFYETHDIFPDLALQLGGGQNIYEYSYYGIASPLYTLAYALPFVRMSTYIQVLSLLTVWVSAAMSYYLFKRRFKPDISLLLAMMFLCSGGLIYHSNMQIMFMNYMPFFMGMLFLCEKKDSPGVFILMAAMAYGIMCTSFYFSIGCFGAVGTYMIYLELTKDGKAGVLQIFKNIWLKIAAVGIGVCCSAFMWMPTLSTIFGGRDETNQSIPLWQMLIPAPNFYMIIYNAYSMGVIGMVFIASMYMLRRGKRNDRFLALIMVLLTFLPILNYILNAMMYISGKMYIPFTPVILILFGSFITEKDYNYQNISAITLIFAVFTVICEIIYAGSQKLSYNITLAAGCAIEVIFILYICRRKKGRAFKYAAAIFSFIMCVAVNCPNKFVKRADLDLFYDKEIAQTVSDITSEDGEELYRFSNCIPNDIDVNRIYSMDYLTTNSYSSINNKNYRYFRFESSLSENRVRNTAVQNQPNNIMFDSLMGCRYRLAPVDAVRLGEIKVKEMGDYAVFRNEYALPMGYASSDVMSEEQFKRLPVEQKAQALVENIIIPQKAEDVSLDPSEELIPDLSILQDAEGITYKDGVYSIDSKEDIVVEIPLDEPVGNRFIVVTCNADNRIGRLTKQHDIALTINGVKNKLTDPTWKYNNKNYNFRFVITPDGMCDKLTFRLTKGLYTISDLKFHCIDLKMLADAMKNKDACHIDRRTSLADVINGTISVKSDGWFNLSVPYDKGYRVTVDGNETEYFKTNTAFIGFPISKGDHEIRVEFEAPLKKEGMIVSLVSLILLGALAVVIRYRKKR